MAAMYEVVRSFQGAGQKVYRPGEVVDASGFRTLDKLVAQRRLRPVTAEAPASKSTQKATNGNHA